MNQVVGKDSTKDPTAKVLNGTLREESRMHLYRQSHQATSTKQVTMILSKLRIARTFRVPSGLSEQAVYAVSRPDIWKLHPHFASSLSQISLSQFNQAARLSLECQREWS